MKANFAKKCLGLAVASAFSLGANASATNTDTEAPQQQPNVVLIFVDDIGYADMGFQNLRDDIVTPNMDKVANEGAIFTAGYVTGSVCGPSRAGLLTGRYQQRFGYHDNIGPYLREEGLERGLDLSLKTFGNYFQDAGYTTGYIGKSHDGDEMKFWPHNRGFDEFYGFNNGAADYFVSGKNVENAEEKAYSSLHRNGKLVENFDGYLTDIFGDESVDFIERHKDSPFFLYVPFNASHGPMHAKAEDLEKFSHIKDQLRRKSVAMTYNMDLNVGKIINKLEEHELMDNTMIIFLSDNGGKPSNNGSINHPLRDTKGTTYDGGIRIPFSITYRGNIPAGQVIDDPAVSLDILPTTLAIAGVEPKAEWELEGVNLMPRLTGQQEKLDSRFLYWKTPMRAAIRDENWKIVIPNHMVKRPRVELYKISEDIGEKNNVADKYPEQVDRLMAAFEAWDAKNEVSARWGWNRDRFPYGEGWRGKW
ncbi:sulfatase-like hydrolase/transferase [Photobacterium lutimaris]|uniref:Sulfatase n=1 Tax=Photobacterium lutimaris TaxID=388278 RepID=A0A2T3IYW5_9GAMM|nr:sulfatase-like hydrolase/transferase [Photobacterium lutimaris]PSU33850.1 sulfatase [Photobacterium lutimaris]TDR76175.1 arylsulfatase A-like enzyme [Photobacterium lutimaris]